MIDIHNHALYSIDDGSSSIEESINIIKKLHELGFNKIVLTPHYIPGSEYNKDNLDKVDKILEIKNELKNNNIPVLIYPGNEIFINNEIEQNIDNKVINTINNSKYLLIEFSLYNILNNIEDILYELTIKGYKIIIAHPERYTYYQDNYKLIDNLLENNNIYLQCNYNSIIGKYGNKAKKLMKYLLKNNLVTFLGTDCHKQKSNILETFPKCKKKIIKIIGEEQFTKLSTTNIEKVLLDKEIDD